MTKTLPHDPLEMKLSQVFREALDFLWDGKGDKPESQNLSQRKSPLLAVSQFLRSTSNPQAYIVQHFVDAENEIVRLAGGTAQSLFSYLNLRAQAMTGKVTNETEQAAARAMMEDIIMKLESEGR